MAVGSVSMLGLSLNGQSALNADLIDQLKEADKSVMIKPFETRLTKVYKKQEDQAKLLEKLDSFRTAAAAFSSDISYLKRSVSVGGDSVSVTASDGVDIQNMTLNVKQLAKNSVAQLAKQFSTENGVVNGGAEALTLQIARAGDASDPLKNLSIDVKSGMTLSELRDAINNASGGKLTASILNVGGAEPYSLIVKSAQTGAEEELSFQWLDKNGDKLDADDTNNIKFKPTQIAQDAEFVYNGLEITRSSNTVSDLVSGVTIELKKADTTDVAVSITRNFGDLSAQMGAFVEAYNDLTKFLDEITKYSTDSGEAGSFQGDSRINSIRGELNRILFAQNDEGKNIADISRGQYDLNGDVMGMFFAFSLSDNGSLIYDQNTFERALEQDPEGIERLLRGVTDIVGAQAAGTAVPNGEAKSYNAGDLVINGVAIGAFDFNATDSAATNAQKLLEAINAKTADTGVSARLGASGANIILFNDTGDSISISGDKAGELGLPSGTFSGSVTNKDGIFATLDTYVDKLNGLWEDARMKLVETQLKSEVTSLTDSIQKALDRINAKYAIMTAQFASYNALISKYESSFSAVAQMIEQAANAD
ncbi:MAG: flagellar filament capping protein FliD [Helicobacteraceae bacterium]|jgi:flagellar hook-associated protein 2|nr:flagellar filament capping protein FliD [Helicobacteraceae bacterium]